MCDFHGVKEAFQFKQEEVLTWNNNSYAFSSLHDINIKFWFQTTIKPIVHFDLDHNGKENHSVVVTFTHTTASTNFLCFQHPSHGTLVYLFVSLPLKQHFIAEQNGLTEQARTVVLSFSHDKQWKNLYSISKWGSNPWARRHIFLSLHLLGVPCTSD